MNHTVNETSSLLTLTVNTRSYTKAVAVSNIAFELGEKLNHHAVVTTYYNKVVVELTTHDEGNSVTLKDHEFLQRMIQEMNYL